MIKLILIHILCLFVLLVQADNAGISVYSDVPGLTPSDHYSFKVRKEGSDSWLAPFAFLTECKQGGETNAYYRHLEDWSNSYINFEMSNGIPVEIEISKMDGTPITTAVAHPSNNVDSCEVVNGKAYVRLNKPALFTVDINGQMDTQSTGRIQPDGWGANSLYSGPPIHTVTIFANPFLENKPTLDDDNVRWISPGEMPPFDGDWDTLAFSPGMHEIGRMFRVHAGKSYYIPGDAIVYGTMNNNRVWNDGHNIRIFGHGTLSGERHPHPHDDTPPALDADEWKYRPIEITGARNTIVEGITITDSAMHSLMLINTYQPDEPTNIRWVKIFTWRSNGDGINPFGNSLIEDCFIRTQDDCLYTNGRGIRRVVLWSDANGSSFVLSPIGNMHNNQLVIEDCDVIYNRSIFSQNRGGHVFNLRGEGSGSGGSNIIFRNIRVSDPLPTRSAFGVLSGAPWQVSPNYDRSREPGEISGILFEDIDIAAYSTIGDPETLWGTSNAPLSNFTFDEVTIDGELINNISTFNHNDHVSGMNFISSYPTPGVLFRDQFGDGDITLSSNIDVSGGFNIYKSNDSTVGLEIYEESDLGILDLTGATDDFPWISMISKSAFNALDLDEFSCRVVVDGLTQSHWYLRPLVFNLRSNASVEPSIYDRNNVAPPKGLSLLVGNGVDNCRVALAVSDGLNSEWLWEDTDVSAGELADGFSFKITMNSTNGWNIVFSGASSLPNSITGNWGVLNWDNIFSNSTYVQVYLREDRLGNYNPPRVGMAKAELDKIEINFINNQTLYELWSSQWEEADLSDKEADNDNDGVSNFFEYAFDGNPLDPSNQGTFNISLENNFFTVIHPVHQLDSEIEYLLIDQASLSSSNQYTNAWDSQTVNALIGDYTSVSNHYNMINRSNHFIRIEVK